MVSTDQSRSTPSSWACDDRSLVGQSGQTIALFSFTGGFGMISICTIEAAPWRAEVPMQSDPVSPPPTTTTCLPLALIVPSGAATASSSPAPRLFCWVRKSIAKWMPSSSRPVTSRLRGHSAPPVSTTASKSASNWSIETSLPTSVLTRNVTPSAAIWSMRRSIRCFSILKSGMP